MYREKRNTFSVACQTIRDSMIFVYTVMHQSIESLGGGGGGGHAGILLRKKINK